MSNNKGFLRPLCPTHYQGMISDANAGGSEPVDLDAIEAHGCRCPVEGCSQMYSVSLGHFATSLNKDYWPTTRSPSLRVDRNNVQVLCGKHKTAMFIEAFDRAKMLERFRCPQDRCQEAISH